MKSRAQVCLAVLTVPVLLGSLFAQDPNLKAATYAAQEWLTLVDGGHYGESWDSAATFFQQKVSKQGWQSTMTNVRAPFGKLLSRQFKSASYETSLPGAPAGKYFVIQFRTRFANSPTLIETVTPMQEPNGQWHVSGYFVRPAD
jgi:hypothetical protein